MKVPRCGRSILRHAPTAGERHAAEISRRRREFGRALAAFEDALAEEAFALQQALKAELVALGEEDPYADEEIALLQDVSGGGTAGP